ncbi:three-finger toxin MALT0070C-like isoform X7 [Ambystoma mexicanum]|uniref:three-finger toxin MALT0070C-like isoform X6 n=1 Tax=Ambystoma mexicanum TaxID=8296 RepID=UPI0037E8B174
MKVLVGALLTAAVLLGTAHSLQCYTCLGSTNFAGCPTITCPPGPASCISIYLTVGGESSYGKGCEETCTESTITEAGVTTSTKCCSTDLCNGAPSARASYAMLTLAAGACALLLRAGL